MIATSFAYLLVAIPAAATLYAIFRALTLPSGEHREGPALLAFFGALVTFILAWLTGI